MSHRCFEDDYSFTSKTSKYAVKKTIAGQKELSLLIGVTSPSRVAVNNRMSRKFSKDPAFCV